MLGQVYGKCIQEHKTFATKCKQSPAGAVPFDCAGLGPSLPGVNSVHTPEHDVVMTNVESDYAPGHTPPGRTEQGRDRGREGEAESEDDSEVGSEVWGDEVERLAIRPAAGEVGPGGRGAGDGVVMYADVLNVYLHSAGPCDKRGTYRVRAVLYDGFQPLSAGPGLVVGASSARLQPLESGDKGLVSVGGEEGWRKRGWGGVGEGEVGGGRFKCKAAAP